VTVETLDKQFWGKRGESSMGSTATGSAQHQALFDQVHKTVVDTIIEVVGQEFYEESDIGLDSSFAEDIELESTEVLEIGEKLIEIYEEKVDFIQWFAEMDLEDLIEITLRDFVDFIVTSLEEYEEEHATVGQ
jgi:acyl carrier protein